MARRICWEQQKMSKDPPECSSIYEICIGTQAEISWQEWFEGMTITDLGNGEVLLTGLVVDQSALFGLLNTLRDLNLTLIYAKKLDRQK
jgi:hypothetical protein